MSKPRSSKHEAVDRRRCKCGHIGELHPNGKVCQAWVPILSSAPSVPDRCQCKRFRWDRGPWATIVKAVRRAR